MKETLICGDSEASNLSSAPSRRGRVTGSGIPCHIDPADPSKTTTGTFLPNHDIEHNSRKSRAGPAIEPAGPRQAGANMVLPSLAAILALVVTGDTIVTLLEVPIPGAVIGMLLLTGYFAMRAGPDRGTSGIFEVISPHFPIFFVPAAAGIVANLDLLSQAWLDIGLAVVAGTSVTIIVTGSVTQRLLPHRRGRRASS